MNRVKEYRKKAGMTQPQAAEKLGISVTYLSLIENGKANLTEGKMRKFAELFGTSVSNIFFAEDGNSSLHQTATKKHR